jgi:hypothetical protein
MARNLALLFHAEPPDDEHLGALFYNREVEKKRSRAFLMGELPRVPLSVHGPTRSGKSHFARLVVREAIEVGAPFTEVLVRASDKTTPRRVLAMMFHAVLAKLPQFPDGFSTEAHDAWQRSLGEFHAMRALVEDPSRVVDVEMSESEARSRSLRFGVSFAPSLTLKQPGVAPALSPEPKVEARVDLGGNRDTSAASARKVRVQQSLPTDESVVELILALLELRRQVEPGRRVLFLVDDLDLLDPRRESGDACSALVASLYALASSGRCAVLVTVRSDAHLDRDKELRPLVAIDPFGDPDELVAIYALRIARFHEGNEVFTPEAVRWLAEHVDGSVGMFLQHCDDVSGKIDDAAWPIPLDVLKTTLRRQFEQWARDPELGFIIGSVRRAVVDDRAMQIGFDEDLPPNKLHLRLLTRIVGQRARYAISPLYFHALRDGR